MQVFVALFGLLIAVLLIIAPLGIWNRLIKIHRDAENRAKKAEEQRAQIIVLLRVVIDQLRAVEEA